MSMDKSAIEQIQESHGISSANIFLSENHAQMKPAVALPKHFELHDLEEKMPFRSRFRGQFSTKSIKAFGAYAEHHALPTPQAVFINGDKMSAKLVLNLGDHEQPGHCDNTAHITLAKTAAYEALLNIVDREKSQQEIAEFIEDWRHNLTAMSEADIDGNHETIPIVRALQAIRSITIEAVSKQDSDVRNFGHTTSGMDSIDAKSQHTLPAAFCFECEPYHELPARTFWLRLSIITRQKPALVLRIIREQEHQEQMTEQFQSLICEELENRSPDAKIYIGTFN